MPKLLAPLSVGLALELVGPRFGFGSPGYKTPESVVLLQLLTILDEELLSSTSDLISLKSCSSEEVIEAE